MREPIASTNALLAPVKIAPDVRDQWRFSPVGLIAASAGSIGAWYDPISEMLATCVDRGVAVVSVGAGAPIMHHACGYSDSFDAIKGRVKTALADPAVRCVLLSIDTPGGMVAGCFDTVTEIREAAAAAGKPIYAYIDSEACSAAYAIALCATLIWTPVTGISGSIGIIEGLQDVTAQDAMMGVSYRFVTSGERKLDRNPHIPFADREIGIADQQSQALRVAETFFALVSERRGVPVETVRAWNGATFIGADAVSARLADRIGTLDSVIAELAANAYQAAPAYNIDTPEIGTMKLSEALKAIQAVADGDGDEKEKADARRMLAKHYGTEGEAEGEAKAEAEPAKGEPAKEPEPENKDESTPHKEPDGDEGKRAQEASRAAVDAARTALLATRDDFTPEQRATLAAAPLAIVKGAVETWPRSQAAVSAKGAVAAIAATGTRHAADAGDANLGEMSDAEKSMLAALSPSVPDGSYLDDEGFVRIYACTPQAQEKLLTARRAVRRAN